MGLTWRDEIGKDFSYDLGLNLSAVRNRPSSSRATVLSMSVDSIATRLSVTKMVVLSPVSTVTWPMACSNWEEVYAHTDEHGTLIQPNAKPGDIRFKDRDHNECS